MYIVCTGMYDWYFKRVQQQYNFTANVYRVEVLLFLVYLLLGCKQIADNCNHVLITNQILHCVHIPT